MQTFLPDPDFETSAKILDNKRLGKQRLEAWQVLMTLQGKSKGWSRHPAVLMWAGFEHALVDYGMCMCIEWLERGYEDNLFDRFKVFYGQIELPHWLGDTRLHTSHQARLYEKAPTLYPAYSDVVKQTCCPGCNYWWPTHARTNQRV